MNACGVMAVEAPQPSSSPIDDSQGESLEFGNTYCQSSGQLGTHFGESLNSVEASM